MSIAGGTYTGDSLTGDKALTFRVQEGQSVTLTSRLQMHSLKNVTFWGPIRFATNDPYTELETSGCASNLEFHDLTGRVFGVGESSSNIRFFGGAWGGYTDPPGAGDPAVAGHTGTGGPVTCGDGIVRNVLFDGVRFHDVQFVDSSLWGGAHPDCLETYGHVDGLTIRNSVFERCGNTFIGFYTDFGDFRNVVIENNLFHDIGKDTFYSVQIGPKSGYTCDVVFRYNTFDPNNTGTAGGPHAPPLINCQSTQVYGNIFRKGPGSDCEGQWSHNVFETRGSACGTNATVVGDAFFVSRGSNYHLRPGSPAVGRGDASRFPARDADGQRRSVDGAPDAGFDEAQGIVPRESALLLDDVRKQLATSAASALAAGDASCLGKTSTSRRLNATMADLGRSLVLAKGKRTLDLCGLLAAAVAGSSYVPSLRLGVIASGLQERNFRSIAKPRAGRTSMLSGTTARSRAIAAAFNAEHQNLGDISGLLTAYVTSVARAQAAGNARDADWQDKQLAAAGSFAKLASVKLSREPALRAAVARALRRAGVPAAGLTAAEASSIAGSPGNTVSAQGRRSLALLGLRPREISALAGRTKQLRASELEGVSLTRSLLERGTVARLRAAAAALRRLGG